MKTLIDQVLSGVKAAGITQKELSSKIGVSPEAISRGKRRGSIKVATIENAAKAANLRIMVVPASKPVILKNASSVWSSPSRKNSREMLYARLTNASLRDMIELCQMFGPKDVDQALEAIKGEIKPAQYKQERSMLSNVIKGFLIAR